MGKMQDSHMTAHGCKQFCENPNSHFHLHKMFVKHFCAQGVQNNMKASFCE